MHVEAATTSGARAARGGLPYDDVLTTADNVSTCRFIVKNVALRNNLHATFMPKPIFGVTDRACTAQSLFAGGTNAFFDAANEIQLSQTCLHYIGGCCSMPRLLRHHNPLVNSYKRWCPASRRPRHRVVREEPQPARARARGARHLHAWNAHADRRAILLALR